MLWITFSIIMSASLTLSAAFITLNHPLSASLILLSQTLCLTLISGYLNTSFWFSYIMFMIMIGGMLVLFIYMTSVASNEKFKFSTPIALTMLATFLTSTVLWTETFSSTIKITNFESMSIMKSSNLAITMTKYFNNMNFQLMIMVILFLLITLIAVVKITNVKYGALRQKF